MSVATRVSLADFLAMEETKPYRELIDGEVVEKAMPSQSHSELVFRLVRWLGTYLEASEAGEGATELRHVFIPEGRVYLPDVSFIAADRLPPPDQNPVEVVPDFVIEVLSPDDRAGDILEKVQFYLRAGVQLIWVVDPEREVFRVYRPVNRRRTSNWRDDRSASAAAGVSCGPQGRVRSSLTLARTAWRECMGVEPTPRRAGDEATVLKTARTTGSPPLPRESLAPPPLRGYRCRSRTNRGFATSVLSIVASARSRAPVAVS